MPTRKNCRRQQKGAGSSDYSGSFHSWGVDPAQLSREILKNIGGAPMFNPLMANTIIPTGTSGIIPTGAYYNSMAPPYVANSLGPPTPSFAQLGGKGPVLYTSRTGKQITNPWIAHVYKYAEDHGLKYSQALKDRNVKRGYKKVVKQTGGDASWACAEMPQETCCKDDVCNRRNLCKKHCGRVIDIDDE
jgi:hypothetical protein